MYKRNAEKLAWNHCCKGKAISITQTECVFVALGIQHAMSMCHIVICGLFRSTTFFDIFSQTSLFLGEKNVTEHQMCALVFSKTVVCNISHSQKKWARYDRKYIGLHVKYALCLSDFIGTWIFFADFRKILKYQISLKSVQWELSFYMRKGRRTGRQTGSHVKVNSRSSQFCEGS